MEQKQKERKFLEQLLDGTKVENYTIPVPIKAELRKYQQVRKRFSSILMYIGKNIKSFQWMENRRTMAAAESYNVAWTKVLGHFCIYGASPPHKQRWTRVSRFFFRVSALCRVGEGETSRKCRKRCTVL